MKACVSDREVEAYFSSPAGGRHSGRSFHELEVGMPWFRSCLLPIGMAQAETPQRVLVLYENNRLLPAKVEADRD